MAGIGLRIDQYLRRGTYSAALWAHLMVVALFIGPWILGVAAFFALRALCAATLSRGDVDLLLGTVTHVYCYSTILTGASQLVLVRAVSDRLYEGDTEAIVPLYAAANLINGGLHLLIGFAFWWPAPLPAAVRIWSIAFFVAVGLSWQAAAFLGCLSRYGTALLCSALAYGGGTVLGTLLGARLGLVGVLIGFSSCILLAFGWISGLLFGEFRRRRAGLGRYVGLRMYPELVALGLVYNLALWADRFAFWILNPHASVVGPYVSYAPYEHAVFLAYLTTLPAQAIIIVRLEVVFFRRYVAYHTAVVGRGGLSIIRQRRDEIIESLRLTLVRVVAIQGSVTLLAVLLAPQLLAGFGLAAESLYMFRAAAVGAFLVAILQGAVLVMLYLGLYRLALSVCSIFLVVQVTGAIATLAVGFPAYGFGFLAASFVGLAVALPAVAWCVRHLDYHTFALQPV